MTEKNKLEELREWVKSETDSANEHLACLAPNIHWWAGQLKAYQDTLAKIDALSSAKVETPRPMEDEDGIIGGPVKPKEANVSLDKELLISFLRDCESIYQNDRIGYGVVREAIQSGRFDLKEPT